MKLKLIYIIFCSYLFSVTGLLAQEAPPSPTDDSNWISSISYNISGQTLSKSVGFFNNFGRPEQSQHWDVLSGKVWGSETLYDYNGRPGLSTLSAPLNNTSLFTYDSDFLKENSGNYETSDFDQGSFIENPKAVSTSSKLGAYFNNNSTNQYQDNTSYPFSRVIYSKLNPGATKKVLGGNKINNKWLQTYSFSMPSGQELSNQRAFNDEQYNSILVNKTINRDIHGVETVVFTDTDGNTLASARSGNEAGDNNTEIQNTIPIKDQGWVDFHISQGCSQNITLLNTTIETTTPTSPTNNVPIGSDCFQNNDGYLKKPDETKDCIALKIRNYESNKRNTGKKDRQKKTEFAKQFQRKEIAYINLPEGLYYRVYDLITEEVIMQVVPGDYTLPEGFYRIELRHGTMHNFPAPWSGTFHVSYNVNDNPVLFDLENKEYGVRHCQNYYDYALNYYDRSGRLLKTTQPKRTNIKSDFSYNSLGQLLETKSPDEGEAKFIYRKDGQIRFSQNSKQLVKDEFSYTNYDRLGRPIESGVYRSGDIEFYLAPETPEEVIVPIDTTPYTISLAHDINVITNQDASSVSYTKANISGQWNVGFTSQEVIEENGKVRFEYGGSNVPPLTFFDNTYAVVLGLSPVTDAPDPGYTGIKYGIKLEYVAGENSVYIYENGDFLRDSSNVEISFGTYTGSDVFAVERTDGVITYLKNDIVFHTTTDNYTEPLVVDASFKYSYNAINNVIVSESNATPEPPAIITIDIQDLVNTQDGLNDSNCFEQHFTLYDIPDRSLNMHLKRCGLSSTVYKQTFLSGNVSKTYTRSPETTISWYSYDVYGRVKWLIQKINGLDCLKTIDYTYDAITGQVIKVDYQRHTKTERFVHQYEYNIGGQLTRVSTSVNDQTFVEQAKYFYNETGQLTRTELAENLQGIDYVYNLNGQLKAINHPSLQAANDPGHDGSNGFVADVFGMTLQYHTGDYTRTNTPTPITQIAANTPNQYNGNIQAIQWQNQNGQASTYAYEYNKNNWLKGAYYDNPNNTNAEDYNISNITYDPNGNIKKLKRNGVTNTSGTNAMDDFTYNYDYNSNQLKNIIDTNDNPNETRYDDLKSQPYTDNYVYNSIGQLKIDKQDKLMYTYNASGLVTKVREYGSSTWGGEYDTLLSEDYEQVNGQGSDLLYFGAMSWSATGGDQRRVIAHQEDQEDTYSGLIPIGVNPENIRLPEYCVDFDTNDTYESRSQFNFYSGKRPVPKTYTIRTNLETMINAHHKLSFDVLVLQKQLFSPTDENPTGEVAINADATIRIKQEDGTLIDTILIDSQNSTPSYCGRIVAPINLNFLATGSKVHIEIEVVNDGVDPRNSNGNPAGARKHLYQSLEVDNLLLQVASKDNVAFYYNDRGQRVRKESFIGSEVIQTIYVRDVSGNPMAIYYRPGRSQMKLKEHPVYGAGRIGVFNRESGTKSGGKYVYQLTDHLGNVRAVLAKNGTNAVSLVGKTDYYPGGMAMPNRNVVGDYRYDYQGQELDKETGKHAFELRLYDSRINRWMSPDPARQYASPYLSMGNSWVNRVDPDGGEDNPIYGSDGTFRGVDEYGLEGDAIIYDGDFVNGMSQSDILSGGGFFLTENPAFGNTQIGNNILNHLFDIPNRPDFDGVLTLNEANNHYRNGRGEPLYVDRNKINLFPLTVEDHFGYEYGKSISYNFINNPVKAGAANINTGLIYGTLKVTLEGTNGKVHIGRHSDNLVDIYDFNQDGRFVRDKLTRIGEINADRSLTRSGVPYIIYGYGQGRIPLRK